MNIEQCLEGWSHIMCDMTLNNELTDVRGVNVPTLESDIVEK